MKYVLALSLLCFVVTGLVAQDKTSAYYNAHESEILPDAQAAFRNGDYDRAVELCRLHYVVVGDNRADALRDKARECAKLTIEMNAFASAGQRDLAREKAQAILSLNPDDKKAQGLGKYDPGSGVINGHEWVDLELSVKWATCNVGASSPEECGSYFAWGETRTKSEYTWENYKFRVSGASYENVTFSKYNTKSDRGTVDNKTRLDLGDDAARANWGSSWRMPTRAEQDELRAKCTWTWTTQGGKNGYKVTGKNGNSIFLPAAGRRYGASLNLAGSHGYYWSSSLPTDLPYIVPYYLYFDSGNVYWYVHDCYCGFPVRPVSE